jgi:hypothetical protein
VAQLADKDDTQIAELIRYPQPEIDDVEAAKPGTWTDVRAVLSRAAAKRISERRQAAAAAGEIITPAELEALGFNPASMSNFQGLVDLKAEDIKLRLAALEEKGFDAVKILGASRWMLKLSPKRLSQVAGIVARLEDKSDAQIQKLNRLNQPVIDEIEKATNLKTWAEVKAKIRSMKSGSAPGQAGDPPQTMSIVSHSLDWFV